MKKFWACFCICLMFILFVFSQTRKEETFQVLEVVEGDKIYIDLNSNGKKDEDELIHIKDINTFPLKFNEKSEYYTERYGISAKDTVLLGYLAKEFTKEKLLNKRVSISGKVEPFNKSYNYRFAKVKLEGKDFAALLLEEGYGIAYENKGFNPYKSYEDIQNIKRKVKNSALKLTVLDKKYKIFHETDCPVVRKIKEFEIVLKGASNENFEPCKYCILKNETPNEAPAFNKASISKTFGNVSIFLENPLTFEKPSPLCRTKSCKALLNCINSSNKSIDFALYGLEGQFEILNALESASKRGVKIRGVVDSKADGRYVYFDTKKLKNKFEIKQDNLAPFMHNKFFIFDGTKVFTGTMNISNTGSGGYNANTSVIINNTKTSQAFENEFNQMFSGKFQAEKADFSLQNIPLSGGTLDIFFSPAGNAYSKKISSLLKGAKKEIYVSIFYLTHKGIVEDLINAKRRGVDVKILYDSVGASNMRKIANTLRDAGIPLKAENWSGKDHEKNMEIDGTYFITGSSNFSNSGFNKNDENILIFKNPEIAAFYRAHFLNLFSSVPDKYLKFTPRAESFESGNSCFDGIDNNFDGKTDSEDIGCKKK